MTSAPSLTLFKKGGEEEYTNVFGSTTVKANPKVRLSYIQFSPNFVYLQAAANYSSDRDRNFLWVWGKSTGSFITTSPGTTTTTTFSNDVKFDGEKIQRQIPRII